MPSNKKSKKTKLVNISWKRVNSKKLNLLIVAFVTGIIGAFIYFQSSAATSCANGYVPYYRLYKNSVNDHFYTTSSTERDSAVKKYSYKNEGTAACVKPVNLTQDDKKPYPNLISSCPTGYVKFYRFYSNTTGNHFYTSSSIERATVLLNQWFKPEGVAACVTNQLSADEQKKTGKICASGHLPFYRSYNSKTSDHFYTANLPEWQRSAKLYGYNLEGVAACVTPTN